MPLAPLMAFTTTAAPSPSSSALPPASLQSSSHSAAERKQLKKLKKTAASRKRRSVKHERLRTDAPSHAKGVALLRKHQTVPLPMLTPHTLPLASTAWIGLRDTAILDTAERERHSGDAAPELDADLPDARAYMFEETMGLGMVYVPWDGTPTPLVDVDRLSFGLLAGFPRDEKWSTDVAAAATSLMEDAAAKIYPFYGVSFTTRKHTKKKKNGKTSTPASMKPPQRRGDFRSKTISNAMGSGQDFPMASLLSATHMATLVDMLAKRPFQRIAGFTNAMFQLYAPGLHNFYETTMDSLHSWDTSLRRNFDRGVSVFSSATINVRSPSRTSISPTLGGGGGHLILWDLKLVIRFPPGATIIIPSVLLHHSNIAIQAGETRYSFTQYTAEGIFRFVRNGFRTEKAANEDATPEEKIARELERAERWTEGLRMYKTWDVVFEFFFFGGVLLARLECMGTTELTQSASLLAARRVASANYRKKSIVRHYLSNNMNPDLVREKARIRMANCRAKLQGDPVAKEEYLELARANSKLYREKHATFLAQHQRLIRMKNYCEKHGTGAWIDRERRWNTDKGVDTQTLDTQTPQALDSATHESAQAKNEHSRVEHRARLRAVEVERQGAVAEIEVHLESYFG
ncbi:hypothetical protein C8J57DRAFT_1465040 [Mycena rebaudengoi]|nr:hypothetical protein C8J57DRAFT_1465040 [Mycena rebaudengoi]